MQTPESTVHPSNRINAKKASPLNFVDDASKSKQTF